MFLLGGGGHGSCNTGTTTPKANRMSTLEPESLTQALKSGLSATDQAIRNAYAEGYKQGVSDATERMTRAALSSVDAKLPAILGEASTQPGRREHPSGTRMSPPRVGLAAAPREFQYGSVIATFRQALLAQPDTGITRDELLQFCEVKGIHVTKNQFKDTMKRLIGGEEAEKHHDAYFAGPRLKNEVAAKPMNTVNGSHRGGLL